MLSHIARGDSLVASTSKGHPGSRRSAVSSGVRPFEPGQQLCFDQAEADTEAQRESLPQGR